MSGKVFLVIKEDLVQYPPILAMINALVDLGRSVVHVGVYSDESRKKQLNSLGVEFFNDIVLDVHSKPLRKIYEQLCFKEYVRKVLAEQYADGDTVCVINEDTMCLLWSVVKEYNLILYFLETPGMNVRNKYRIYNPRFHLSEACQCAHKVVCCEYNRAHIIKGLYQLDRLPIVLPNKYYETDKIQQIEAKVPNDIQVIVDGLLPRLINKKIIIYQGVFTSKERRLEEYIQAVLSMPAEFVLLVMGRGSEMFSRLKEQYSSHKIIFIDFVRPPYHLLITKMAHVGILSYLPVNTSFIDVLNPIYCAPNKVYEYSKYGLPMIANDLPALKEIFTLHKCGELIDYPLTAQSIRETLNKVFNDYNEYRKGAIRFYNDTDVRAIVNTIFS